MLTDTLLMKEFVLNYVGKKVYCTMSSPDRFDELIDHIIRIYQSKAFDRIVVVCNNLGQTKRWSKEQLESLHNYGVETYEREWNNSFPDARNDYIQKCQHGDYIVVSDTDEHFNDKFLSDIDKIFNQMNNQKKIYARINAHDKTYPYNWKKDDSEPPELVSGHMKLLIFKYIPGLHYQGIGETKNIHETLMPPPPRDFVIDLSKEYYYVHTKTEQEIWARALRNVVTGGGGNNAGEHNKAWKPLLEICSNLNIHTYYELDDYLKAGNIDQILKDWIIQNRQMGMNYENEMVDIFKYYFYYLHPEEKPVDIDIIDELDPHGLAALMSFVGDQYIEILGRHASDKERYSYAIAIIEGRLTKDELAEIFRQSDEYKQKHQSLVPTPKEPVENLPLAHLPISVDLKLTENIIDQILRHSKFYNQHIKSLVELGKRWMIHAAINYKIETGGLGNDEQPLENYAHYINDILLYMPLNSFKRILDIGAGAGDETKALLDAGYEPIGITIGPDNVKSALDRYKIKLLEEDMHCLRFPKDYFDAVILIHTYEHSYASNILLGELYHVLRDYGRVYVAVPDPEAEESKTIWHVNLRLDWQIIEEFQYWGFKLINVDQDKQRRDKYTFVFEKLPAGDPDFTNYGYLQHIIKLRELL
jgi:SAM-dependent methyltransferase